MPEEWSWAGTNEEHFLCLCCWKLDVCLGLHKTWHCIFVGMLGRYQSNLGIDHWKVAKKVMRYFQGTKDYMLMYRWTDNLEVIDYSDSDYPGCIDLRKSTLGCLYASWWSCFLKKHKTDFDYNFHYGGWVCVLFRGYLARCMVKEFHFWA